MDILTMFDSKVVLNYLKARTYPVLLGETLFPETKIDELEFSYIKGADSKPVAATIHSFDTESQIASREGMAKVAGELALIKRKIKIGEKEIIKLSSPRSDAELEYAKANIFNDVDKMVEAVRTRVEVMRIDAISTGQLVIAENNVTVTIDYGVPGTHKDTLLTDDRWSETTATPLEDIFTWVDTLVTDKGGTYSRALTSKRVLNYLLQNTGIRRAIWGVNADKLLTKADLNQFLASQDLPQIETYDEQYRVQNANGTYTTKRYLAVDKFIILPDGQIGETLYGPTPEEIELLGKPDIDGQMVGNIYAGVYRTVDPVAHWTKAAGVAMPTFPAAEEVFQAVVL